MKNIVFRIRSLPVAFLALCFISYGLLIPWLGFYWDDWPYLWFSHVLGPQGLVNALAKDRPFLAVIYMTTTSILGASPIAWQIFAILCRWVSVLVLWWTLRKIWPNANRQTTLVSLLFAVYPGFGQHWISVIYSQAYLLLAASIASLGLMIWAIRSPRGFWPLTIVSLLASLFSLLSTEYFFGLEMLRPLFIWFVLSEQGERWRTRARRTLLYWLPYIVELAGFWVWRTFFFESNLYTVQVIDQFKTNPVDLIFKFVQSILTNSLMGGWKSWGQTFEVPHALEFQVFGTQLYWLVTLIGLALTLFYLLKLDFTSFSPQAEDATVHGVEIWAWQAVAAGVSGLLIASMPFWAAGLEFGMDFPWDRFMMSTMIGSCLALTGITELLIRTTRQKLVVAGILISMAIGLHFQTANGFRRDWNNVQSFFWQLSWRMPNLKPGTMILTHELPFKYYSDNSLSAPLNWMYDPDNHSTQMAYILNYATVRNRTSAFPEASPNLPTEQDYRALKFKGNTSDVVVISYALPGCLRVLDPVYTNEVSLPDQPYWNRVSLSLTNFDRIIADESQAIDPPTSLFGPEPAHTWCYYFQKAELARQQGDWQKVAALGKEAFDQHLEPVSPATWSEILPFVEGFARTGDWEEAASLTRSSKAVQFQAGLCQVWKRLEKDLNPPKESRERRIITSIYESSACNSLSTK